MVRWLVGKARLHAKANADPNDPYADLYDVDDGKEALKCIGFVLSNCVNFRNYGHYLG